jgi:hypothetical protein
MDFITKQQSRARAMNILKTLAGELPFVTADIFYQSLRDAGFTEDETVRLTGACIRSASSQGWIDATSLCQNSVKNNSNLQKVWKSKLWSEERDPRPELAAWFERGFKLPIDEFTSWQEWKTQQAKNVS